MSYTFWKYDEITPKSCAIPSIRIPSKVNTIGKGAFMGCRNVASIIVDEGNTSFDSRENCNAIIETSTNTLIAGSKNTIIPNSVDSIGRYAFSSCHYLNSINIPSSVTSTIDPWAFEYCYSLTSIVVDKGNTRYDSRENCNAIIETATNTLIVGCQNTVIPDGITTIGFNSFYGCINMKRLTIPCSVTTIENAAFYNCIGLTDIYCYAETPPSFSTNTFNSVSNETIIHVPANSINDYQNSSWRYFNIVAISDDEVPTGITDKETVSNGHGIYDLNGRRLQDKPIQKGVYILKGKKIVMK